MSLAVQLLAIAHNTRLAAERASREMGSPCAFDRAAVVWLERHIQELRTEVMRAPAARRQALIDDLGAVLYPFFGECFIRTYGGQWAFVNGYWGIDHRPRAQATTFPQKKIYRALAGDTTESPLAMFDIIGRELG
jgi:hypothetical protein